MKKNPTDSTIEQELSALRAQEQTAFDEMMMARAEAIGMLELNISWISSLLERAQVRLGEMKAEMKQDFDKRPIKGIAPITRVNSDILAPTTHNTLP